MKITKIAIVAAAAALAACVALTGCGGSDANTDDIKLVKEGTLTIGSSPDYPPFENLVNEEIVGYEVDLWNKIAEDLGLEVEVIPMNFDGILTAVASGNQIDLGISGFTITPERQQTVDFTTSFYTDDIGICAMKDSGITEANADEMLTKEGIKIAVQSGTTGQAYMEENYPNAEVIPFTSSNDCFAAMNAGKADVACTNSAVVSSMVEGSYTDAAVVKMIATGEEYGIAVNKDNAALTAAINDLLAKYQEDGTIDDLMSVWF